MSLAEKRLFLLDMDGTLYLGDEVIHGAIDFIHTLEQTGRRYIYLTNNSSRSPQDYARRLTRLGVEAGAGDFLTSTDALIALLRRRPPYRLCYVLGTDSFREQLRQVFAYPVHAAVIGTAITRPREITRRFVEAAGAQEGQYGA